MTEEQIPPMREILGIHNEGETLFITYRSDRPGDRAPGDPQSGPAQTPPSVYRLELSFREMAVLCQHFGEMLYDLGLTKHNPRQPR